MNDQTLLNPEEEKDLIPYAVYKWQLDELEKENLIKSKNWIATSRKLKKDFPSDYNLKLLHKKMFEDVWKWAGKYRETEKNIGNVMTFQVQEEMKKLCDDTKYQLQLNKISKQEIAVRFHHRLTCIHPFPNGNGRFAREATNLLLKFNGEKEFAWGANKKDQKSVQKNYIKALRAADKGDFTLLIEFIK